MVENHLRESGYSDDGEANSNSKSVSPAHVGEGYSAKIPSAEMQRRFNTPTDSKFLQNDGATDPVMSNGRDAKCRGGVSAVRQRHRTNLSHKRSQRLHSDDTMDLHFYNRVSPEQDATGNTIAENGSFFSHGKYTCEESQDKNTQIPHIVCTCEESQVNNNTPENDADSQCQVCTDADGGPAPLETPPRQPNRVFPTANLCHRASTRRL